MRLGLGTVQFGQNYGVSNTAGVPSAATVRDVLRVAMQAGVRVLDTASQYGDSEKVLGECLPAGHAFNVVTKTPSFKGVARIDEQEVQALRATFAASLHNLRAHSVYGLLIHRADDLLAVGGDRLFAAMKDIQAAGEVRRLGVSVYDARQLEAVVERFPVDLVQLPVNIFDQTLVASGWIDRLRAANIQVHARSPFLQGLLLMEPSSLPPHFAAVRGGLTRFREYAADRGLTPLQAALSYVLSIPGIDVVLCGVVAVSQLQSIVAAVSDAAPLGDIDQFGLTDPVIINPGNWPKFRQ